VVGLGTWAISGWMWAGTDEARSINAIRASLDAGVNLIDTAPAYGQGLAEEIVAAATRGRRAEVIIATKFGLVWHIQQGQYHGFENGKPIHRLLRPESIRYEVEASLKRLGTDYIDLYQSHWQEAATPIEDTMDALLRLKEEGKIRAIGVSNVSLARLTSYQALGPIDSDQEEYHMLDRDIEAELLPFCRANGIAMLAYSPLAQGLLTGKITAERTFPKGDLRRTYERFNPVNRAKVSALLDSIKPIASAHGATLAQLAIAWTISPGRATHALVSARNPEQAIENAGAGDIQLTGDEVAFIDRQIENFAPDVPHLW
jgi:aryl-alcohol dehydrogenase-like predicted oxidoreductase